MDIPWLAPEIVRMGIQSSAKPMIEVILQIGGKAIEEADNDPVRVVQRLEDYNGIIHRVGRGLGMDASQLIPFAKAIRAHFPRLGLGAAGGLGPNTIDLIRPLVELFGD